MANNPTFLEQMVQKEYLNHFQTRNKWKKSSPSLKMGNLVLKKEDNGTSYYLDKTSWTLPNNNVTRTVHKQCL